MKTETDQDRVSRLELQVSQLSADLDRQRLGLEAVLQVLSTLLPEFRASYAEYIKDRTEGRSGRW